MNSMKLVKLASCTFYGKELSGTFPFVEVINPSPSDDCKRDVYIRLIRDGKTITVQAYRSDMEILNGDSVDALALKPTVSAELTDSELSTIIAKRFAVMDRMTEGVVDGSVRALIISGAGGIGKTFGIESRLREAESKNEIKKFSHLKGKITPMSLYVQLFMHKNAGDVIMFDDNDAVFGDENSLNILKTALDTGKRNLSWKSTSSWLEDNGIDDEFDFEGSVIFVTNLDFDRKIDKGGSDAPHYAALISRSNYLDLKVQTPREVFLRMKQVVDSTDIMKQNGLTQAEGVEMMEWVDANKNKMREISIRTILKMASYIKADKQGWRETAEILLLR